MKRSAATVWTTRLGATLLVVAAVLTAGCGRGEGAPERANEGAAPTADIEHTATDAATPGETDEGPTQCAGSREPPLEPYQEHFLKWALDGSLIMYDDRHDLVVVSSDTLEVVYETQIRRDRPQHSGPFPLFGTYADFHTGRPDIVFATCQPLDEKLRSESSTVSDYFYSLEVLKAEAAGDGRWEYAQDGELRLTRDERLEHYPVWSPDGTRIAFLRHGYPRIVWQLDEVQLFVMDSDGSGVRMLTQLREGVALLPPVWSQDGSSLMFLVNEGGRDLTPLGLYRVGLEGGSVERIGGDEAVFGVSKRGEAVFALSSDGATLAREDRESGRLAVSIVTSQDGTLLQRFDLPDKGQTAMAIQQLAWSPDEKELLVIVGDAERNGRSVPSNVLDDGIYVLEISSGTVRTLLSEEKKGFEYQLISPFEYRAAWSPDGARIAVRGDWPGSSWVQVIFIVGRDGTDLRMLVDRRR